MLLLIALFAAAGQAAAQNWMPLPAPPRSLTQINATLLQDGRILIVGSGGLPLLFDARGGAWHETVAPPADLDRGKPMMVLLPDGTVFVTIGLGAGATGGEPSYTFDPRTDSWTPKAAPNLTLPGAAALLPNGRVLVTGEDAPIGGLPSAEIYDPATDNWSAVPPMSDLRPGALLLPLPDGRLLSANGFGSDSELFDPNTSSWSSIAPMLQPRAYPVGLLMPDGRVLTVGDADDTVAGTTELFDPVASTWTAGMAPMSPMARPSLALLPDGRVLAVTGTSGQLSTQFFQPGSSNWTPGPDMSVAREAPRLIVLPDGRVIALGGVSAATQPFGEVLDLPTYIAQGTAPVPDARNEMAATVLADGRVLVAGGTGNSGDPFLDTAAIYTPATDSWQPLPTMSVQRSNRPDAVLMRDGRVMIVGGAGQGQTPDIYDPVAQTRVAGAPHHLARRFEATAVLSNGWVLTTGGDIVSAEHTAEMYVPEADRWLPVADMPYARQRHAAVRLADDRVLVVGGHAPDNQPVLETAIFDLRTNAWTPAGAISVEMLDAAGFLLPDGRVLATGHGNASHVWDPATNIWTSVPIVGAAASGRAFTQGPNGEVLAIGGSASGGPLADILLFDPVTMTWRKIGELLFARSFAAAVTLPDGRVMVVGGLGPLMSLSSTEIVTITRGSDATRTPNLLAPLSLNNNGPSFPTGSRFSGPHLGSGSGFGANSASNYPLVEWRSLSTNAARFLPVASWTDGLVSTGTLSGLALGPASVRVITNGLASVPRLATVGAVAPTMGVLQASAGYSSTTQTVTLTAQMGTVPPLPSGGHAWLFVTDGGGARIGDLVVSNVVQNDGLLTATWTVPANLPTGHYTVHAIYGGDALHEPVRATGDFESQPVLTTVTVTPATSTPTRGDVVLVSASVTPVSGGPITGGTIALTNGVTSCTVAAPGGSCDMSFPSAGLVTVSGSFTPATTGYLAGSGSSVVDVRCTATTMTPDVLPNGVVGEPYSVTITPSGGAEPYELLVSGGFLPEGLTLSGHTISGTPTTAGARTFTVRSRDADSCITSQGFTIAIEEAPVVERVYTLAEGVSNSFFSTFVLLANPNATEAPVSILFAGDTGVTATESHTLAPFSRLTIATGPGSAAAAAGPSFATRVTSTSGLPLLVERATYFDAALHAGDLSTATEGEGSVSWAFAEGANGYFHTYLTLGNLRDDEDAAVTVRYLPEGGAPFERAITVPRHSRVTIDTLGEAALASAAFGMTVTSTVPVAADRVQYFGSPFIGAHADSGARSLSADWYFAEGAGGAAFDTYLLLANPSAEAATANVVYHTDGGELVTRSYALDPGARRSIGIEGEDARLAVGAFWIEVHADRPIVAERAMYLSGASGWTDATATTGATALATRWGFAEGVIGKEAGYAPYLLLANPRAEQADVLVQYLRASGGLVSRAYTLPAASRLTIDVRNDEPSLADAEFGILVTSTNGIPIVAERSLYWTLGGPGFVGAMNTMGTPLPAPQP